MLATATEAQREVARTMPGFVAPRAGATAHPMTTLASAHMIDLIGRADRFNAEPDGSPAC